MNLTSRKRALLFCGFAFLAPALAPAQSAPKESSKPEIATQLGTITDDFTLTTVGDLIYARPLLPRLLHESPQMVQLLRGADVTFGNFEDTAIDLTHTHAHPQAESGGNWMLTSPLVARDLKDMGFKMVGRANNHATDWGVEGLLETDSALDESGLIHAGTGSTLAAARAPQFLDTSFGRVSLVSFASTFTPMSRALDPSGQVPGRAGLNALRTTAAILVSKEQMATLKQIQGSLPSAGEGGAREDEAVLSGAHFRLQANPAEFPLSYTINASDEHAILTNIMQGRQSSDFEIATIHTHEPGNGVEIPPAFLQKIAHESLDNGADAFVGHGPHRLRGIEIYKGKPIFYSLGNFFFMEEMNQPLVSDLYPSGKAGSGVQTEFDFSVQRLHNSFHDDAFYESVIAVSQYRKGELREIKLYPVSLHSLRGTDSNGIPHMANASEAEAILSHLRDLSKPLGTDIQIDHGIGVIHPHAEAKP